MDYVIQLSKKKNLSIRQKIGIAILFGLELPKFIICGVNNFFGIEPGKEKIMFYGFYSFCSLVTLFSWVVAHRG